MTLSDNLLQSFSEYPFDDDVEFQNGLSEILSAQLDSQAGPEMDEAVVTNIVGQAKAYYFSSKCGIPFSWEEYLQQTKTHSEDNSKLTTTTASVQDEHTEDSSTTSAKPSSTEELSFAQITALIESGQTHLIPNNEIVPGGVNDASPSKSTASSARKPWEKEVGIDVEATV